MSSKVVSTDENPKKALLIGLNYPGTNYELWGCINDVKRMQNSLIMYFGFSNEDIKVLVDTDPSCPQLTAENIKLELSSLVDSAKPGDTLFFHFSGHGWRRPSQSEDDDTGFDEYIIAVDWEPITDDYFRELVDKVPRGCSFTIVSDSCHSGGLIEAAKEQIGESTKKGYQNSRSSFDLDNSTPGDSFDLDNSTPGDDSYVNYRHLSLSNQSCILKQKTGEDTSPKVKLGLDRIQHGGRGIILSKVHKPFRSIAGTSKSSPPDSGILLSACQSDQRAQERRFSGNIYGVFSNAVQVIIEETHGQVTNRELVLKAREKLSMQGFPQKPGLYCSDHHADAPFLC